MTPFSRKINTILVKWTSVSWVLIMRISYTLNNRSYGFKAKDYVEAVYIFGSFVSGGYKKQSSDIDHLIIIDEKYYHDWHDGKELLSRQLGIPKSWITIYTKKELKERAKDGDYFLWAIKLNSKKIYTKTDFVPRILRSMPVFNGVREEMIDNKYYVEKLVRAYQLRGLPGAYMKSQFGHLFRNGFINLLYLKGIVEFNKINCAKKCMTYVPSSLGFTLKDYLSLYNERSFNSRDVEKWHKLYVKFLKYILKEEKRIMAKGFTSPLLAYKREDSH